MIRREKSYQGTCGHQQSRQASTGSEILYEHLVRRSPRAAVPGRAAVARPCAHHFSLVTGFPSSGTSRKGRTRKSTGGQSAATCGRTPARCRTSWARREQLGPAVTADKRQNMFTRRHNNDDRYVDLFLPRHRDRTPSGSEPAPPAPEETAGRQVHLPPSACSGGRRCAFRPADRRRLRRRRRRAPVLMRLLCRRRRRPPVAPGLRLRLRGRVRLWRVHQPQNWLPCSRSKRATKQTQQPFFPRASGPFPSGAPRGAQPGLKAKGPRTVRPRGVEALPWVLEDVREAVLCEGQRLRAAAGRGAERRDAEGLAAGAGGRGALLRAGVAGRVRGRG